MSDVFDGTRRRPIKTEFLIFLTIHLLYVHGVVLVRGYNGFAITKTKIKIDFSF